MHKLSSLLNKNFWITIISTLIIILCLYLRYLILSIPLSVDEGYWAYIASLLLKGKNLFIDVWSSDPPVIYWAYYFSERFLGHGLIYLRITGVVINLLTIYVIFLLTSNSFNKKIGFISVVLSLIYTISFQQEGHFVLNGEQLSQLPLFLSLLLFVLGFNAKRSKQVLMFFFSGILMGLAWNIRGHYLILQSLLYIYILFGLLKQKLRLIAIISYSIGSIIPFTIFAFYFFSIGKLLEYFQGNYIDRFFYLQSAQSATLITNIFYILNDRMGHILWLFIPITYAILIFIKDKDKYKNSWIFILLISSILILLSTGYRLFNHYFLYLTYGLLIVASYGLWKLFIFLKENSFVLYVIMLFLVFILFGRQIYSNYLYLKLFNNPIWGLPYKNLIINEEMINYFGNNNSNDRVIFLGESIPYYYYINRDMKDMYPIPGFFVNESYRRNNWNRWITQLKKEPPMLIVEDYGIPDVMTVKEFSDYFYLQYEFDRKINQHYIFRYKGV